MQRKEPGLTTEVFELIQKNEELILKPKGVWQAYEMAEVYKIYNAYTGESKRDSGCGACRTSVLTRVRKIYDEYKRSL